MVLRDYINSIDLSQSQLHNILCKYAEIASIKIMKQKIIIFSLVILFLPAAVYGLGTEENKELADWYEQAHSYYSAVQSGVEPKPAQAEWSEFLNQMNWAYQELHGSKHRASDPFGGITGPQGNIIYKKPKTHIGFLGSQGNEKIYDIYSNDISLDVAPKSARVTVKQAKDKRVEPPEDIIKIIVKDPATIDESIYYLHNIHDIRSIRINTPGGRNVIDKTGEVTIGKFKYKKPKPLNKKNLKIKQLK